MDRGAWRAAAHGVMKTQLSEPEHTAQLPRKHTFPLALCVPPHLSSVSLAHSRLCPARQAGLPRAQALLPFLLCNIQLFLRGIRSLTCPFDSHLGSDDSPVLISGAGLP